MPDYSIYSLGVKNIKYIVSDLNGTLALDGDMIDGIAAQFKKIRDLGIEIYVLTGDIHGNAEKMLANYNCKIHVVDITEKNERQDIQKLNFIKQLGQDNVCAIGNGGNDALMLEQSAVGILVIGKEGGSTKALLKSNVVVHSINDALDLFTNPKRLAGH